MSGRDNTNYVSKQYGLAPCHNGSDPSLTQTITGCVEYKFPPWLSPYVLCLWCVFAVESIIAILWLRFFWVDQKCRRSIFRFKDNRTATKSYLHTLYSNVKECCSCRSCLPSNVPDGEVPGIERPNDNRHGPTNMITNTRLPQAVEHIKRTTEGIVQAYARPLGMPQHRQNNEQYSFVHDFLRPTLTNDDVVFGHKVFRMPTLGTECLRNLDKKMSPKFRIFISYMLIYASIMSLVLDYFIDVKFLNDLSTETLMDVKYIHFDEQVRMIRWRFYYGPFCY